MIHLETCEAAIVAVEGERVRAQWKHWQDQNDSAPVPEFALRDWQACASDVRTIYGFGGGSRYFVRESGEVVFSARHGSEAKRLRAEAEGFTVE